MRRHDLVFDTLIVQLKSVLGTVTLEDVKIFNCELLVLVPPYPQALVLPRLRLLLEQSSIQQIKYLLVVNLKKRA